MKRTLTLVIEFDQDHRPNWIWDSHKEQLFMHGFFINIIAEGNQLKDYEDDEEKDES